MANYKKFRFKTRSDGGMQFEKDIRDAYVDYARKNPDRNMIIEPEYIESSKQRRFFEGGLITLFAYLDGHDYKDSSIIEMLRENVVKPEFNPITIFVNGKPKKAGGSTKGNLPEVIERFIDWMEVNYAVDRVRCMNPKHFKYFRDKIYGEGEYDTYIDYLVDMKRLPAVYLKKYDRM